MASISEGSEAGNIRNVIRIDEGEIRNHLDWLVKTSVEEVLNQYLDQGCPLNEPVPNDPFRRWRSDGPFVFCFSALGPGGSRGHG